VETHSNLKLQIRAINQVCDKIKDIRVNNLLVQPQVSADVCSYDMTPGVQSQFVATQSQGSSSIESQEMTIAIRMTLDFLV